MDNNQLLLLIKHLDYHLILLLIRKEEMLKKKTICKRIKNIGIKKYYIIIYNARIEPNHRIIK